MNNNNEWQGSLVRTVVQGLLLNIVTRSVLGEDDPWGFSCTVQLVTWTRRVNRQQICKQKWDNTIELFEKIFHTSGSGPTRTAGIVTMYIDKFLVVGPALKGTVSHVYYSRFLHDSNPSGPVIHMLKYFPIWFCMCKKLLVVADINGVKNKNFLNEYHREIEAIFENALTS